VTLDPKEFRLYPRKPRQRIRDESKAWSIAFKRVMHYARMSRKRRRGASASATRPRKRFNQRCAVRVIYSRNKTAGQWRAHGRYIMRESARGRSSAPTAFTDDKELADLAATLGDWQKAGDERLFKLIISPEFGDRLDLQKLTCGLMRRMEKDLHTRLEWAAVTHFNTEHPHVHIALRGIRDNGASLQLSRDYIKHGIRTAAEELVTLQLGYRTEIDAAEAQRREIDAHRYTSLDRIISRENGPPRAPGVDQDAPHFMISRSPGDRSVQGFARIQEQHVAARLMTLEKMGLAEPIGNNSWLVRQDFENILRTMQRVNDRQKMLAAHGSLLSDERLQLLVTDLRKLKSLEGRVVLHGEEEAGREAGRAYLLLEGIDARLHHVYYTPEIHRARSLGKLRINSFIRLRRIFSKNGRPELAIDDLGDCEKVLRNQHYFQDAARWLISRGIVPTEDGWTGWLGRYQAELVNAAAELQHEQDAGIRKESRDRSRGRS
jgi:type IV secretory pathway VirD2 relaxase